MAGDPSRSSKHFAFEAIADGVRFGRARREGTALSNTTIVDLGDRTLVFDTSLTLEAAREIRAAALAATRRAPALVVNSHWHFDHLGGNQEFASAPIYATRRTREIVLDQRAEMEEELTPTRLGADLLRLEHEQRAAPTAAARAVYENALGLSRALLAEGPERRLTPPTATFEDELRLPGDRDVRLMTFGSGHTESDAILYLRKEGIVCAGDLVVAGTHPNLVSGDPRHWIEVLDRLRELRPRAIVTGHGPLGTDETIATMRDYLVTVLALARGPGTPEVPERFRAWPETDQFAANIARARGSPAGAAAPSPSDAGGGPRDPR